MDTHPNLAVERLNNKAKVISHKAYGFRTVKSYIRNPYHCMAELPLPKTVHTFALLTGFVFHRNPNLALSEISFTR